MTREARIGAAVLRLRTRGARLAARALAATRRQPLVADVALALAVFVASCVQPVQGDRADVVLTVAVSAGLALPLVARRRHPLAAFGVIAAFALVQWLLDLQLAGDVALLIGLYSVAVRESRQRTLLAGGVLEIGAVLAAARWGEVFVPAFVGLSALVCTAAVLGINVRNRRELVASLEERAARLELERDQQGRLAAAAERSRIARELHDIVAHSLTVMVALADGATLAGRTDPQRAAEATRAVSATGREALGEMRRLLGVLRDDEATGRAPQPGVPQLEGLAEQVRGVGLPVSLAIAGDVNRLSAGLGLTVYRIAQEALTNALKHADNATTARLVLAVSDADVALEIVDDGETRPTVGPTDGRGLLGMRERAAVFGGSVEAGPLAHGRGWRVAVRLRLDSDHEAA